MRAAVHTHTHWFQCKNNVRTVPRLVVDGIGSFAIFLVEAGTTSAQQACARANRIFSPTKCLVIQCAKLVVHAKLTTRVARSHRSVCVGRLIAAVCDMRIAADGHGPRSGVRRHVSLARCRPCRCAETLACT
eukprot:1714297-Pleurochrysis_carterae.AAC.2